MIGLLVLIGLLYKAYPMVASIDVQVLLRLRPYPVRKPVWSVLPSVHPHNGVFLTGLLYKASPNGCQHRYISCAEAKALPSEGALAHVKCTCSLSSTSLMCHSCVHADIGVMCKES